MQLAKEEHSTRNAPSTSNAMKQGKVTQSKAEQATLC
jgi:hypothetical protein